MTSLFALVDCNNFYASCERLFRPDLEGQPVVVLSNNDGCVIARSNEAKALGIKMGAPLFLMQEVIKRENVHVFSSNYELYGDLSIRVIETLRLFTPRVEVYSIDESFLDLGDFYIMHLEQYAANIRNTVTQHTGIPVSIGVSLTKTLAKVANRTIKKWDKAAQAGETKGVLVLTDDHQIDAVLQQTDVEDVWGVGRQYSKFLQAAGIHTAFDLKNAKDSWIKKHLSVVMLRTVRELRGEPCLDLELLNPAKKGICTSRSFGRPVSDIGLLQEATATFAARCAQKLRKQQCCAKVLTVFVTTNKFADTLQYFNSKEMVLPTATNSNLELIKYTSLALNQIYKPGYLYKKSGVVVTGIMPEKNVQLNLLDQTDHFKQHTLMQAIDEITQKLGKDCVRSARQGTTTPKDWNLRREHVSPCYTTRLNDILAISI
jgi:DNA polymerase V